MHRRTKFLLPAFIFFSLFVPALVQGKLLITAIQVEGGRASEEFVEITNAGTAPVSLLNFSLKKQRANTDGSCKDFETLVSKSTAHKFTQTLQPNTTLRVAHPDYPGGADLTYATSGSLTDNTAVTLLDDANHPIDTLGYGRACTGHPAPQPGKNQRLIRKHTAHGDWQDTGDTAADFELFPPNTPTPSLPQPSSPATVRLNEILPNPTGNEKLGEYIELFNFGTASINLKNWTLRDASKTGHYTFSDNTPFLPGAFLVVPRTAFIFALNNGNETVSLFDPSNVLIDTVSYDSTHEERSYNFSSDGWHWSQFLTPGHPNHFDATPVSKTSFPKDGYVDMPIDFSAYASDADGDSVTYTWDFGDGHKSYKAETTHTYKKAKKYTVTLTINDGSEPTVKTKTVTIEKYPRHKVRIVSLTPNPVGADTGSETIVLQNLSKKTIRLKNWKIATQSTATGKNKKSASKKVTKKKAAFTNHLITTTIVLKPKQTVALTHADSKFSLNNSSGKIALRTPDNRIVQTVAYAAPAKATQDGAQYVRHPKTHQWAWISGKSSSPAPSSSSTLLATHDSPTAAPVRREMNDQKSVARTTEPAPAIGSKSLATQPSSPLQPLVLGAYTVHPNPPVAPEAAQEAPLDLLRLISETINEWMRSIF